MEPFESIIGSLFGASGQKDVFLIFNPVEQFEPERNDDAGIAQTLNGAFLIALAGRGHSLYDHAMNYLKQMLGSPPWASIARFYLDGVELISQEIKDICENDLIFLKCLNNLSESLSKGKIGKDDLDLKEQIWSIFFPEAVGIQNNEYASVSELRKKRTVTVTELNRTPISDPAGEIIFTSNILLTIPSSMDSLDTQYISEYIEKKLRDITQEKQHYWYDHPIQVGVAPEKNEVVYGLKGLETAFEFERDSGNMGRDVRPICIMSVSVTHKGLHGIAKRYLEETLSQTGGIHNMDLYVFTEEDTQRIIDGVLCPAIQHYGASEDAPEMLEVFGVDGEYGRHYNFLKSIAAFWAIFIKPEIKATFKIDLDQIFPQKELKRETGFTAFEHFITPLWGSQGIDYRDRPLDLGLLAGALVNEKDIRHSLFTPDIHFPDRPLTSQEYIFFSQLPQALSTEAEMMTRYTGSYLDGKQKAIQRVHVTGGTNGILINSLRHHRPFTPSFIGRAEDQAYILSVLLNEEKRLAYVHKDGLIMRHDKEIFAQEAMESSYVGKLLGDYIRILYFSAYAKVLCDSISKVKVEVDPFTGCFISRIPKTVVYLRFGLQTGYFFMQGDIERGIEFVKTGTRRIGEAIGFVDEKRGILKQRYKRERKGWNLFYDMLSAIEQGLKEGEIFAMDLQKRACNIIKQCLISNNSHNDMR